MCLSEGTVFDQQEQAPLPVAGSVEGFAEALKKMQRGGRYKIIIPPEKGYKDQAAGAIPPNSPLYFDVELLDFRNAAEVRAMMQQMQQMQGAPGGHDRQSVGEGKSVAVRVELGGGRNSKKQNKV